MLTPDFFFLNTKAYKRINQYYRNPNETKNSDISQLLTTKKSYKTASVL